MDALGSQDVVYSRRQRCCIPRFLHYLAPNLVTSFALILGLLSMVAAHEGRFVGA